MKPLHLIALVIAFMLLAPVVFAGGPDTYQTWRLSAEQDGFYREFGGRIFQVKCGNQLIYVKKKSDGRVGFYHCETGLGSPNVFVVQRHKRRWKRIK